MIPVGPSGKEFILKMTRLFTAFVERSSLQPIALQAVMTMPALLLQKPHNCFKAKDHIHCLKRRLEVWKAGRISELVQEGRVIQQHLPVPAASKWEWTNSTAHLQD